MDALGPGGLAKEWCPAVPKAAVYANSTTPAWSVLKHSISLNYGLVCANICAYLRRWFHAYVTLVHRAGSLQPIRPCYSTIAVISLTASAIPRLFREYRVPFFTPEDRMNSRRASTVRLMRSILRPVLLADFTNAAPVTSGLPLSSVCP